MKDRLKGRLLALFPKANLSKERIDSILDRLVKKLDENADDTALDTAINDANDLMDFEALAKQDDRIRTLEAKAKGDGGGKGNEGNPNPNPAPPANDVPDWAKEFIETNKTLASKLEAFEKGQIIESKRKTISGLFDKSDVLKGLKPELKSKWINRIDVESETSFEDQIKDLETEYSELVQVSADNNQYSGAAGSGNSEVKPDEKTVESIVDNMVGKI